MTYDKGVYLVEKLIGKPPVKKRAKKVRLTHRSTRNLVSEGSILAGAGQILGVQVGTGPVIISEPENIDEVVSDKKTSLEQADVSTSIGTFELRDTEAKDYSTLHDTKGIPIIKLYFGQKQFRPFESDQSSEIIASSGMVKGGSLAFVSYERDFIQSSFSITQQGYDHIKKFLFDKYPSSQINKKKAGRGFSVCDGMYNVFLKYQPDVFLIQTGVDISKFKKLRLVGQPVTGPDTDKLSFKLNHTTQQFNKYIYYELLDTYRYFRNALFQNVS